MSIKKIFKYIGISGYPRCPKAIITHKQLYFWLCSQKYNVIIEYNIAKKLNLKNINIGGLKKIGKYADLIIIVGGDGNMLNAARILSFYDKKIIGINRGNLGFLTDLTPTNAFQQLIKILQGHFYEEQRILLEIKIKNKYKKSSVNTAINEIILHSGKIAHMIEFEVYIDNNFAFSQRSDGLIITTPTGSTAYSLSAGGPILTPNVNAIALIPMFAHTLSSRPLIINSNSFIELKFKQKYINYKINCDGQIILPIKDNDEIFIHKSIKTLNLIHPKNYNYFNILNSKLGWSKKFF